MLFYRKFMFIARAEWRPNPPKNQLPDNGIRDSVKCIRDPVFVYSLGRAQLA